MRPHTAQKHAGKEKCVRTLPENTSGKQSAPAHCPKTRGESNGSTSTRQKHAGKEKRTRALPENMRGKQREHSHTPQTHRGGKMRPRTAQKHAGKEKCVRALPKNAPWKAMGALPRTKIAPRRQNASAHCPKTCVGSNGSTPTRQKHTGEAK